MSELTQCNYCSLQAYRREAKHNNMKLTLMQGSKYKSLPHGIDVYVHPRSVNVRELSRTMRQRYWRSWFMELSDHCVC
jgi:hypothetical protein